MLTAFQQVEDSLSNLRILRAGMQQENEAVRAADACRADGNEPVPRRRNELP